MRKENQNNFKENDYLPKDRNENNIIKSGGRGMVQIKIMTEGNLFNPYSHVKTIMHMAKTTECVAHKNNTEEVAIIIFNTLSCFGISTELAFEVAQRLMGEINAADNYIKYTPIENNRLDIVSSLRRYGVICDEVRIYLKAC